MGFTHRLRNVVVGSALTAGAVAVMQGAASADEPAPPAAPAPGASPAPAKKDKVTAPVEQVPDRAPTTKADEVEQPPRPAPATAAPSPARVPTTARTSSARSAAVRTAAIDSGGPLTRVDTSPDLNCSVKHAADADPAFFDGTACGTFLAANGQLFGPDVTPNSTAPQPRSKYTRVRQSPTTGSGSLGDPYKVVTDVEVGTTGLSISQTDTYVTGQEAYRTDVTVTNSGTTDRAAVLYRAGDCVVGDEDFGFGSTDPATGAVACVEGVDAGGGNLVPGKRTQQWYPLSPGSSFVQGRYPDVWAAVGSQRPFPDLCVCTLEVDNAAGLSWEIIVPAGGSVTRSHLTIFSPLGSLPLTVNSFPRQSDVLPGTVVTFRIEIASRNDAIIVVNSVIDTLPAGFTYVPGTTAGAVSGDPVVDGQVLRWAGPIQFGAGAAVAIEFGARAPLVPGTYVNQAGADAGLVAVVPVGAAPLTVLAPPVVPSPPLAVGGTTLTRSSSMAPPARRPAAAPARVVTSASAGGDELPVTGSEPGGLVLLGGALLAAGSALVTVSRRGRSA